MKKMLVTLVALLVTLVLLGQEPEVPAWAQPDLLPTDRLRLPDSLRVDNFIRFDTLLQPTPLPVDFRTLQPLPVRSSAQHRSVSVIRSEHLPARVSVINNNMLRMGRRLIISNGQAWNHGAFPNSFLDARTISLPMPR